MTTPNIIICPDQDSLNRKAAAFIVDMAHEAIAARGRFAVALAGGSTPQPLYALLATLPWRSQVEWSRVHVFWSDERLVPADHSDSNYRMANLAWLSKVPVPETQIHRVRTELGDADAVALAYERTIRRDFGAHVDGVPRLDLCILGLGADGHTASLFPYADSLVEDQRLVTASFIEHLGQHRITVSLRLINQSRNILFFVSGTAKAGVVKDVIAGERDPQRLPAQLIRPTNGTLTWMLDQAAASELTKPT